MGILSSGCAGVNEYLTEGIHQVTTIRASEETVVRVAGSIFVAKGYRFSPIKRERVTQPYYHPLTACSSAFHVSLPNQERRWCEIALQPQGEKTLLKVVCFRPPGWPFQDFEGAEFEPPSMGMQSLISQVKKEAERSKVSPGIRESGASY